MGFLSSSIDSDCFSIGFNTDTMYDAFTGYYQQGVDGEFYLNGGLRPHFNMIGGPNGSYKSALMNSFIQRAICIYKNSDGIIIDSEQALSQDIDRALRMAGELFKMSLKDDVAWKNGVALQLNGTLKFIEEVLMNKRAKEKDMIVETPFFDPFTGQPFRYWIPTFIFLDSLTQLMSERESSVIEDAGGVVGDGANTSYMVDANDKTRFVRALLAKCVKYGVVMCISAHYKKGLNMNGQYNPTPKQTPYAKQDWKLNGVGGNMIFVANNYVTVTAKKLEDPNKEAFYDMEDAGPTTDISEVVALLERCKTAAAGTTFPFIVSQSSGLLNAVSNYHYLREKNYYGLVGNKQRHSAFLYPSQTFTRNTLRQIAESSPEVRRALQIAATICFIKNNWNLTKVPYDFSIEPQALFDSLTSDKNKEMLSDVLASRSYWTYEKDDRPYMSIFRILDIAKAIKTNRVTVTMPPKQEKAA